MGPVIRQPNNWIPWADVRPRVFLRYLLGIFPVALLARRCFGYPLALLFGPKVEVVRPSSSMHRAQNTMETKPDNMKPDSNAATILIVEDDPNIASLVAKYLENDGFTTVLIEEGQEALPAIQRHKPSLVVLDLMLPGMDGWEICREVRRQSDLPILMLTAREDEMDRVVGLSLGADDYVVKPFSPRELVERVKAILRRVNVAARDEKTDVLRRGALTLEPMKHKVTLEGEAVALTRSEYTLLHCLMATPGRVYSRSELLERLYSGGETVIDRVVDVHIGKLRQKIERDPSSPFYIQTIHGVGYCFNEEAA